MADEIIKDDAPFEVIKDADPFQKPADATAKAPSGESLYDADLGDEEATTPAPESNPLVTTTHPASFKGKGKPATAESLKAVGEGLKGVGSGVAQSALGTGQALTSFSGYVAPETAENFGNMEAQWQTYLKSIGDPTTQVMGKVAGDVGQFMLGGEALEATKLAPYAAKILPAPLKGAYNFLRGSSGAKAATTAANTAAGAEKTQGLIKTLADSLIFEPAKGAVTGVGAGALGGATDPRTEATEKERNEARWKEIWSNIPNPENWFPPSLLFGTAAGVLGGSAKAAVKSWDSLTLAEKKAGLKAAQDAVKANATEVQTLAVDAKSVQEAKAEAAQQAVAAGMTREEAEAHVAAAEKLMVDAQATAKQIADDFKNLDAKSQTDFGEFAQKRLDQNRTALEKQRDDEVGFTSALENAPKGKVVDMTPVIEYIDSVADKYEGTPTGNMLAKIKKELQGKPVAEEEAVQPKTAKEAAEELFKKKTGSPEYEDTEFAGADEPAEDNKISIENANQRRKYWNHLNNTKKLNALTSLPAGADDEETVRALNEITKRMNNAAGAAHPPYMDAVNKFREFSAENLDVFDAAGFKGVTNKNINTNDYQKMSAEVTKSLLKMARLGDTSLAEALNKDPEFKEQARQLFRGELFGVGNAKKNITDQSFTQFWQKNQELIEEAGLTKEFKDLESKFKAGKLDVEAAKKGLETTKKETTKKVKETEQAASDLATAKKKQTLFHDIQKDIELAKADKTLDVDDLVKKSEGWLEKLRDNEVIDQATHDAMKERSREIETEYKRSKQTLADAEKKRNATLAWLAGLAAVGGSGARWLGYNLLSNRSGQGED